MAALFLHYVKCFIEVHEFQCVNLRLFKRTKISSVNYCIFINNHNRACNNSLIDV